MAVDVSAAERAAAEMDRIRESVESVNQLIRHLQTCEVCGGTEPGGTAVVCPVGARAVQRLSAAQKR
jgi:hypothetical protein